MQPSWHININTILQKKHRVAKCKLATVRSFKADVSSISLLWQRTNTQNSQLWNSIGIIGIIDPVDNTKLLCYTLPLTQYHSFFRNLPTLTIRTLTSVCIFSTLFYNFPNVVTRRICLPVKNLFDWFHSLYPCDLSVWSRTDIARQGEIRC